MAIGKQGGRPIGLPKTGGRQKGTPNRDTLALTEKLDAISCDPLMELAKIGMDRQNRIDIRVRCFLELASYVYPKRKPVDISSDQSTEFNVNTNLDHSGDPYERKPEETSSDTCAEIYVNTDLTNAEDPADDGAPQS